MRAALYVLLFVALLVGIAQGDALASSKFRMPAAPKSRTTSTAHSTRATGPIVAFKPAKCKSPGCFAKHPTGEYMIPIRQKTP